MSRLTILPESPYLTTLVKAYTLKVLSLTLVNFHPKFIYYFTVYFSNINHEMLL